MSYPAVASQPLVAQLEAIALQLSVDEALAMLGEIERLRTRLVIRVLLGPPPKLGAAASTDEGAAWLSSEDVTKRFGLSPRWLHEHRAELRRRRVLSKPSRKASIYHAGRLNRFLDERTQP